ncbi:MAG TPA: DsbA family protein [Alphaproteobacteria bacterium]|nr:DsbA family protein [Alphaproteobacteria bacterium]
MRINFWNRLGSLKNQLLAVLSFAILIASGQAYSQDKWSAEPMTLPNAPDAGFYKDDYYIGNLDARVVIIEYASLTCPHCANFHVNFLPSLKKDFVDTGKVLFVFRDFPLDEYAFQATMIAQCAPRDSYFAILDQLFTNQQTWVRAENISDALDGFAQNIGIDSEKLTSCYADEKIIDRTVYLYTEAYNKYGVRGTPSLVINGQLKPGFRTYEELQGFLNTLLK